MTASGFIYILTDAIIENEQYHSFYSFIFIGSSQYFVGKSWIAAAGLDSADPHPLIPSPTRKDTRERAYPRRCCAMRTSGEMAYFVFFSHPALMTAPSPFFRRGDQGVRSSGAVDSPDFQKNTCVRDGYYASTHTKLRRAFLSLCEIFFSPWFSVPLWFNFLFYTSPIFFRMPRSSVRFASVMGPTGRRHGPAGSP